jgi:hypothetical protein
MILNYCLGHSPRDTGKILSGILDLQSSTTHPFLDIGYILFIDLQLVNVSERTKLVSFPRKQQMQRYKRLLDNVSRDPSVSNQSGLIVRVAVLLLVI